MILACLISITISGVSEQHLVTGKLKSYKQGVITADFSNAVSGLDNVSGVYDNVAVDEENCTARLK